LQVDGNLIYWYSGNKRSTIPFLDEFGYCRNDRWSMFLVVGLGNPGKKYDGTRHNIGYNLIDVLAKEEKIRVICGKHRAFTGSGLICGQKVLLAKPVTFMNLSGESVRALATYYKVDVSQELIVISDDVSMPVGQLRIRKKGSSGGHNGLKSIIEQLGRDDFIRIRIGVGEKPEGYDLADYVLGHFDGGERKVINNALQQAVSAVRTILETDADKAMNQFNAIVVKTP
jgi:PTH1 family peptidyl-tRNA hydrolase